MTMLSEIPEAFNRIVRNSKENLFIAGRSLGHGQSSTSLEAVKLRHAKETSKLYAFPDTVKVLYIYNLYT